MVFETNSFLRFALDELKMQQLCKLITIRMSKHILSISCKGTTYCQFDEANIDALSRNNIRLRLEKRKLVL